MAAAESGFAAAANHGQLGIFPDRGILLYTFWSSEKSAVTGTDT